MRFLLLTVLIVGVSAYPADFTLTVDMINKMLDKLKTESQYVPSYILDPLSNATDAEKQQFVDLMNKLNKGQVPMVSNMQQFIELIEKEAPLIGPKARAMYDGYMQHYNNLTPEAKQFVTTWENKWFSAAQLYSTDKEAFFKTMVQMTKDLFADVKKLSPETWASLKQEFPENVKAWEENPQMKAFRAFMESLPKNSDLTKDPEIMDKFMQLGLQKLMPAEETKA